MRKEKLEELREYINELRVIKKERIEREKTFLKVEAYNITLNNGVTFVRERIMKGSKDGSACMVLPVTQGNEVITIVQPRVFTDSTVCLDLPAGYMELNEIPEVTAERELHEETGYVPGKLITLGSFCQDHGISSALNHYYLGLDCKPNGEQHLDIDEQVRIYKCTVEELYELLELGYIKDLNAAYTLTKAKPLLKL